MIRTKSKLLREVPVGYSAYIGVAGHYWYQVPIAKKELMRMLELGIAFIIAARSDEHRIVWVEIVEGFFNDTYTKKDDPYS